MNTKDLMIGDWVLFCGSEYHITKVDFAANYEFEPIPLTSEIMEKNGFNLYPEETNVFILNSGYRYDLDTVCLYIGDIERPSIYGNDSLGEKTYVVLHCKYVHEFQHVLKMCGIEKEIVL